jgi:hypothetical protein
LAEIPVQILFVTGEVYDWVADELAGPVIGYVAASLDFVDLYSAP